MGLAQALWSLLNLSASDLGMELGCNRHALNTVCLHSSSQGNQGYFDQVPTPLGACFDCMLSHHQDIRKSDIVSSPAMSENATSSLPDYRTPWLSITTAQALGEEAEPLCFQGSSALTFLVRMLNLVEP